MLFQQQHDNKNRYGIHSDPTCPYLPAHDRLGALGDVGVSALQFQNHYDENSLNDLYGNKKPIKTRYDFGSTGLRKR